MVGDAGAQVVDTDYQAENGVVHYLDRVLASLPAAAPSASMSAMESEDAMSSVMAATSSIAEAASSATEAIASAVPTSA